MENKSQKLKSSNTSSNLKKCSKHTNDINVHKNNYISNTNNSIFNKNNNNCKLLKMTQTNNIFANDKDKIKDNKKPNYEVKDNKLIIGIEEEKDKEKIRQNSYSGQVKTEDGSQNFSKKSISISKKSFIGKANNFSPFISKMKKDISINNENINNNNIPNNNNNNKNDIQNKSNNKINQNKTLIKVKENKKKFTRTFSGYGVKRKSSMSTKNINNNNFNLNNKSNNNYSQNKQKEQNNNINKNNIVINSNDNEKSKNNISNSE